MTTHNPPPLCPASHSTGTPASFWHCTRGAGHPGKHRDTNGDEWSDTAPAAPSWPRDVAGVIGADGLVYSDADPGL